MPQVESRCPFRTADTASFDTPLPPKVKGPPFLGNTFRFLRDTSRLLDDSYRRHGAVFRLRALWLKYTVIGGFEAREFLLQGLSERYLSRHKIFDAVGVQLGGADFVLGQSGDRHARLRRLLALAYSREVASPFVPDFIDAARRAVLRWKPGGVLSVMPMVKEIAFEQYCRVMCGCSLEKYYADILTVVEYNMNVGGRVWPFFLYRAPWYRSARKRVLETIWAMLREYRSAAGNPGVPNPDAPKTIMETLLSVRDKEGVPLTDDEVVCYSMYGFAGSASYMSRLVAFMLYEILKNPALKESLLGEVDRAFAGGLRNAADVRRMELLGAVYHETLRFHPVSQGMPFYAEKDFVYEGAKIRAGDVTVLSQVPMSFSAQCFRDPLRFDHTRMLSPRQEHRSGGGFHPYGIGNRTCTAMGLVELMAVTMVATILHERRIEMTPAGYDLKLTVRPLPAPNDKFRIKTFPRQTQENRGGAPLRPEEPEDKVNATFPGHDDPGVHEILASAGRRKFQRGEVIVTEGEIAKSFYIIETGSVLVSRAKNGSEEVLAQLREGQYFGEIGLLHGVPRTATVTVIETAQVLELSRDSFMDLIERSDLISGEIAAIVRKQTARNALRDALHGITPEAMARILPEFTADTWSAGAPVIREGDTSDRFYIVADGVAVVTRRISDNQSEEMARLTRGEYFGEAGLLANGPRTASVGISDEGPATLLSTGREGFQAILDQSTADDLAQTMLRRTAQLNRNK